MPDREYTEAEIEAGIVLALAKEDITVVPSLIALLALQNPGRAEQIRQTILSGLKVASEVQP